MGLSDRNEEVLKEFAKELGERTFVLPCSLGEEGAEEQLIVDAEEKMGKIDILINNAGLTKDGLFMRMKDEDWDLVLKINLTSGFKLARAAIKGMMKRRFGRIIGIASIVGVTGNPGQANYSASKAGMIGMTKCLAAEVASRGITANCVAPGFIKTAMTDALSDDAKAKLTVNIPMARLGTAQDVANAVAFLASDEASYVTGQTIHVNGGMAMI
ncbi:MAG: 3-oxoacyl-(acyl-carrier-protein) reductase FabG [Alphaproteobacteria bacterium ADurb.Bin438]|nr:MAG: 3-oxoacyl-(acyl-carrier-protein) reductase FabG [Alphaproteobacteria bacterium ADurb.Bin438]